MYLISKTPPGSGWPRDSPTPSSAIGGLDGINCVHRGNLAVICRTHWWKSMLNLPMVEPDINNPNSVVVMFTEKVSSFACLFQVARGVFGEETPVQAVRWLLASFRKSSST